MKYYKLKQENDELITINIYQICSLHSYFNNDTNQMEYCVKMSNGDTIFIDKFDYVSLSYKA